MPEGNVWRRWSSTCTSRCTQDLGGLLHTWWTHAHDRGCPDSSIRETFGADQKWWSLGKPVHHAKGCISGASFWVCRVFTCRLCRLNVAERFRQRLCWQRRCWQRCWEQHERWNCWVAPCHECFKGAFLEVCWWEVGSFFSAASFFSSGFLCVSHVCSTRIYNFVVTHSEVIALVV